MARPLRDKPVQWLLGLLPALAAAMGLVMLATAWLSADPESVPTAATPGEDPPALTVVIDAGHGGVDGGAVGNKTHVVEAELNLRYACALKQELENRGMTVVLTRKDERALASGKKADMAARKQIMNGSDADIVVSIHMNKFRDRSASGPMAFYMKESEEGKRLATCVIQGICEALSRRVRLANPADYFIIRESDVPAVLVECGFLSNAQEEELLQEEEHMQSLVSGIAQGIELYFGIPRKDGAA